MSDDTDDEIDWPFWRRVKIMSDIKLPEPVGKWKLMMRGGNAGIACYLDWGTDGPPQPDTALFTADQLRQAVMEEREKASEQKRLYEELLFAVGKKFPDETRHQTALRYIRRAEQQDDGAKAASAIRSGK